MTMANIPVIRPDMIQWEWTRTTHLVLYFYVSLCDHNFSSEFHLLISHL